MIVPGPGLRSFTRRVASASSWVAWLIGSEDRKWEATAILSVKPSYVPKSTGESIVVLRSVLSALREIKRAGDSKMMPSARQIARPTRLLILKGAARVGWDHAPSIYAPGSTVMLLADPNLPADIAEQLRRRGYSRITCAAIIQEDLDTDHRAGALIWRGPRPSWVPRSRLSASWFPSGGRG